MSNGFQVQQVPEGCTEPVTVGDFTVTLVDIVEVDGNFRWIYRIDSRTATALSNWILQFDNCDDIFVRCLVTDPFETEGGTPGDFRVFDFCDTGQSNPNDPCPGDPELDPCAGDTVTGLKFDSLDTLDPDLTSGLSALFAIDLSQDVPATIGCFQLKFGNNVVCEEICVPFCCPDQCSGDNNNFSCDVLFEDPTCFTLPEGDLTNQILYGFCIGEIQTTGPVTCQTATGLNLGTQELSCCVEVNSFTHSVPFSIQFNIPKVVTQGAGACQTPNLYECCFDSDVATRTCFDCSDVITPPSYDITCEDIDIVIDSVEPILDQVTQDIIGVTVNYTVVLPDCQ